MGQINNLSIEKYEYIIHFVTQEGKLQHDFTYIGVTIGEITNILEKLPPEKPLAIMNIDNNFPITASTLVKEIGPCLKMKALIKYLPEKPGGIKATHIDLRCITAYYNFKTKTDLKFGINDFSK